ncbi:protein N-terminal asparagine amidohydrolase-like [Penaeus vannamei]|uniref:protein N-terminal asparagine amidohydrolase-like n=1 Tax=Penaeus vannamei TaxID=6689 RepID=UPI000F67FEE9|nr:protein N-terminal asparagine amidohydrolase-like isoform X1 [Penaeus vannamei]XP_027216273.1 protein N-terminal asparagine amidohydrolase-like isoform X1 [Penaeus vannamei]XP_027216281.1 protein N-terminal asparagine amidohydrolase-like isoform X1 [Penaeus vannamei]
MVIVVEGHPLAKTITSTEELYKCYPGLVEKGLSFAQQAEVQVPPHFTLFVAQGEYGVVPAKDTKVKIVGSDDATTCHVVVIRHPSGTTAVAHFDGRKNEEDALKAIVEKMHRLEHDTSDLELFVVGGYQPEEGSREAKRNESELLSLKILRMFGHHKCTFNLSLWCTGRLNTRTGMDGPMPIAYGVGVDMSNGLLFPAHFTSHEPNLPLRSASRWVSEGMLCDLYDHKNGTICIEPFYYKDMETFSYYVNLPDKVLLKNFSTSPRVEPPRFCDELRKVFQVFVDHPDPHITLFPDNQGKIYGMNDEGLWEQLQY